MTSTYESDSCRQIVFHSGSPAFSFPKAELSPLQSCRIKSWIRNASFSLEDMQQAASEPTASDPGFAGLLASLAASPQPAGPEWNDDQLADDTATFSYEQALRTHGSYLPPASDPEAPSGSESRLGRTRDSRVSDAGTHCRSVPSRAEDETSAPDRCLKRASITIRLSEPECAQIRLRAAEAGLTVSAYLRSCTLEMESLRTQVKEVLAQLRAANSSPPVPAASQPRSTLRFRFWPFSRHTQAALPR